MIYGYERCTVNDFGLKQMRELSLAASPLALRRFAEFILSAADDLENHLAEGHWHKHADAELERELCCDIVVLNPISTE